MAGNSHRDEPTAGTAPPAETRPAGETRETAGAPEIPEIRATAGSPEIRRIDGSPETPESPEDLARDAMVEQQIRARGINQAEVLAAMRQVPRHLFVAPDERREAYADHPLPIGYGQTISQPFIVALMAALAHLGPEARVLEIGTGSGYQAAVLSRLAAEVDSIEIVEPLAQSARRTLAALGYANVHVRVGDGYRGWPERAPFDAIVLSAAPPEIPEPLLAQLKPGGHMVVPVGDMVQDLLVVTRRPDGGYDRSTVAPVRFVPMTGEAQVHRTPPDRLP